MQIHSLVGGRWQAPGRAPLAGVTTLRLPRLSAFGVPKSTTPPVDGFDRDTLAYGTYWPDEHPEWVGPRDGTVFTTIGGPADSEEKDYYATRDGQVIENLIVYGRVMLGSFSNVVVRNCIIYGSIMRGAGRSCIQASSADYRGARVVDNLITQRPDNHNEWCGAMNGGNFTAERNIVTEQPDGFSLNNPVGNVNILGNWIHDGWYNEWTDAQGSASNGAGAYVGPPIYTDPKPNGYYPYSAGSAGKYTHTDCVQFYRTKNVVIRGNSMGGKHVPLAHNTGNGAIIQRDGTDFFNSCLQIKQEGSSSDTDHISNVLIEFNRFEGGEACINLTYNLGNAFKDMYIQDNRFKRATWSPAYYVFRWRDESGTPIANLARNVFDDDGSPVTITRGN